MKAKLLLLLGATACGRPDFDATAYSQQGTALFNLTAEDVAVYNALEATMYPRLKQRFKCDIDLSRWRVKVLDTRTFKSGDETVRGRTDWFGLITIGRDPKGEPLFETSIAHEFAHVFQDECENHFVNYHPAPPLDDPWYTDGTYKAIGEITNALRTRFNYDPLAATH